MPKRPIDPQSSPPLEPRTIFFVLLLAGAWSLLSFGGLPSGRIVFPFVTADVALVALLCAAPLAFAVVRSAKPSRSTAIATGLVVALLTLLPRFASSTDELVPEPELAGAGGLLRPVVATIVAVAIVLAALGLSGASPRVTVPGRRTTPFAWMVWAALAAVLPQAYVGARCESLETRLDDSLAQFRLRRASVLAQRILAFDPDAEVDVGPLAEVASDVRRRLTLLESQLRAPLTSTATAEQRLQRARTLAILDRSREAEAVLQPLLASEPVDPAAANLIGLICEGDENWERGREWYSRAAQSWQQRPASPQREAGRLQALKGVAYCCRKSGDNRASEAAYLSALDLAQRIDRSLPPEQRQSADLHFLLAQFYEDAQQATPAHEHARRAAALAPQRYGERADALVRKMGTEQFGCLSIWQRERTRAGGNR